MYAIRSLRYLSLTLLFDLDLWIRGILLRFFKSTGQAYSEVLSKSPSIRKLKLTVVQTRVFVPYLPIMYKLALRPYPYSVCERICTCTSIVQLCTRLNHTCNFGSLGNMIKQQIRYARALLSAPCPSFNRSLASPGNICSHVCRLNFPICSFRVHDLARRKYSDTEGIPRTSRYAFSGRGVFRRTVP